MEKKNTRHIVAALELTDAETGEQVILPCVNSHVGHFKLVENYLRFATGHPVDENFVLRGKNNYVEKKTDS